MTVGIAILVDAYFSWLLLALHSGIALIFTQLLLRRQNIPIWISLLAGVGLFFLGWILSALWITWMGRGVIIDVELFKYWRYP